MPREANILQDEVQKVVSLSSDRKMLLNPLKTKAMIFNPLKKYDISPQISTEVGSNIEVVEEQKILGNILRSDYFQYRVYLQTGLPEDVDIEKTEISWLPDSRVTGRVATADNIHLRGKRCFLGTNDHASRK